MHEHRRSPQPPGDVADAARKAHRIGNLQARREGRELLAQRPLAEHDEVRVGMLLAHARERLDRDVDPLLRDEPGDREENGDVGRELGPAGRAPLLGRGVEAVVDDAELLLRQPDRPRG